MAELVSSDRIEALVGCRRHGSVHLGRLVTADQTVYILHSQRCLDSGIDLRDCVFSQALDRGVQEKSWSGYGDRPVLLGIWLDRLIPVRHVVDPWVPR